MRILLAVVFGIPANCVLIQFKGDWAILEENGCHLELNNDGIAKLPPSFDFDMSPCFDPTTAEYTVEEFAKFGSPWDSVRAEGVETGGVRTIQCTRHTEGHADKLYAKYSDTNPQYQSIAVCRAIAHKYERLKMTLAEYSESEVNADKLVHSCIENDSRGTQQSYWSCIKTQLTRKNFLFQGSILKKLRECLAKTQNDLGAMGECSRLAKAQLAELVPQPPSVELVLCVGDKLGSTVKRPLSFNWFAIEPEKAAFSECRSESRLIRRIDVI